MTTSLDTRNPQDRLRWTNLTIQILCTQILQVRLPDGPWVLSFCWGYDVIDRNKQKREKNNTYLFLS